MKNKQSSAWHWEKVTSPEWDNVATEMYYLATRWHEKNLRNILDLGCGKGRHTLFFAQKNFRVCGSDIAPLALTYTKEKLSKYNLSASLLQCDMRDIDKVYNKEEFDAILSYRVINHCNTHDFSEIINKIISLLKVNGEAYLVIDAYDKWLLDNPNYEFIEERCALKKGGLEDGVAHYFAVPADFKQFNNIEVIEIKTILDHLIDNKEFNPYKLHILFKRTK